MKNFLVMYKQSIILLIAIILGATVGIFWGENARVLSPFGDIFLNLLLVIIVPLIFLTISTSISNMKQPKRLGKIIVNIFLVFIIMSLVAVLIGFLSTYSIKLIEVKDTELIKSTLDLDTKANTEDLSILERTVQAITVGDFIDLFSRQNIIALILFSMLFGLAMNLSGERAKPVRDILISLTDIVMNFLKIIMYYAPIGLGCYFAALVGTFGAEIAVGYARTFIIYTIVAVLFYFGIYSLYAFISAGKKGIKAF